MNVDTVNPHSNALGYLQEAIQQSPMLEIRFYTYGIVMRHTTPQGVTEKIVSPEGLANAIAQRPISWGTGILTPNTIHVGSNAGVRTVVEYRPPQRTGIWMDDNPEPLRVPLPGLLLVRKSSGEGHPDYQIFAVKKRPSSLKAKLYVSPLPNTYRNGGICWGNVARLESSVLDDVSLKADWSFLLGSGFNNHSVNGKSVKYPGDIRKLLIELDQQKAEKYQPDDLVSASMALEAVL